MDPFPLDWGPVSASSRRAQKNLVSRTNGGFGEPNGELFSVSRNVGDSTWRGDAVRFETFEWYGATPPVAVAKNGRADGHGPQECDGVETKMPRETKGPDEA